MSKFKDCEKAFLFYITLLALSLVSCDKDNKNSREDSASIAKEALYGAWLECESKDSLGVLFLDDDSKFSMSEIAIKKGKVVLKPSRYAELDSDNNITLYPQTYIDSVARVYKVDIKEDKLYLFDMSDKKEFVKIDVSDKDVVYVFFDK